MKKGLWLVSLLALSGCVTHMDVAYTQQAQDCIYSEKVYVEKPLGADRIMEKTITYANMQCSTIMTNDLKHNKKQAVAAKVGSFVDVPFMTTAK